MGWRGSMDMHNVSLLSWLIPCFPYPKPGFPKSCPLGEALCVLSAREQNCLEGGSHGGYNNQKRQAPSLAPSPLFLPTGWTHHGHGPPGTPHVVEHHCEHHQRRESCGPYIPQARDSRGLGYNRWAEWKAPHTPAPAYFLSPVPQHGRMWGSVYPTGHHGKGHLSVSGHHSAPQVQVRIYAWGHLCYLLWWERMSTRPCALYWHLGGSCSPYHVGRSMWSGPCVTIADRKSCCAERNFSRLG